MNRRDFLSGAALLAVSAGLSAITTDGPLLRSAAEAINEVKAPAYVEITGDVLYVRAIFIWGHGPLTYDEVILG